MRAWPIVSSWRKEQFMRKCVMAKNLEAATSKGLLMQWWSIWVDVARIYPPPLAYSSDSSDEEPPPLVSSSDSSDEEA